MPIRFVKRPTNNPDGDTVWFTSSKIFRRTQSWNCPPGMYRGNNIRGCGYFTPGSQLWIPFEGGALQARLGDTICSRVQACVISHRVLICASGSSDTTCYNVQVVVRNQPGLYGRLYVVHQIDSALLARHLANWLTATCFNLISLSLFPQYVPPPYRTWCTRTRTSGCAHTTSMAAMTSPSSWDVWSRRGKPRQAHPARFSITAKGPTNTRQTHWKSRLPGSTRVP